MIVQNKHHTFKVVDKIPYGYIVWNIGKFMEHDDYIPLCEPIGEYGINPNTLKAIQLDSADVNVLRKAAHMGIWSLERAEKRLGIKKYAELAGLALPIFERTS